MAETITSISEIVQELQVGQMDREFLESYVLPALEEELGVHVGENSLSKIKSEWELLCELLAMSDDATLIRIVNEQTERIN